MGGGYGLAAIVVKPVSFAVANEIGVVGVSRK